MSLRLSIHARWENNCKKAFLSLLEFNPEAKVVDLGCGDGKFSVKVKEKIGCNDIIGVDVYDDNLIKAKKRGVIVKKVDLNKTLPFRNNFFDVVISNQVIEHLFYPVKFMKEIYRILRPNGYAVISTENLASWDNIFSLILGYTPFSMQFDEGIRKIGNPFSPHERKIAKSYPPHTRIFTWKGLMELSKFLGFKIEKAVGSGHLLLKFGEMVNKKNCRFITLKVRK